MTAVLEKYKIDGIKLAADPEALEVRSIVSVFEKVFADIILILKSHHKVGDDTLELFKNNYKEYIWTEDAKQLSILMRDITFSKYKDIQMIHDGLCDKDKYTRHRREETDIFKHAFNEVFSNLKKIERITKIDEELSKSWKHLVSPVAVIAEQILVLKNQTDSFVEATEVLNNLREEIEQNIEDIKQNFVQLNESCTSLTENVSLTLNDLQSFVKGESFDKIGSTIVDLEKIYKKIESSRPHAPYFHYQTKSRKLYEIPVFTDEGSLKVKEINFSDQINNWIESELYSSYLEEKVLIDGLYDNALLTLFNVRNRLSLFQNEGPENFTADLGSLLEPVVLLEKNLNEADKKINSYSGDILDQLDENLVVSTIFNKERLFLPVEDNLGYLDIRKSRKLIDSLFFDKGKHFLKKYFNLVFFKKPDAGNALSSTIEYTDNKKIPKTEDIKNSLFFSKGYLGQSFYIHRISIEKKIMDTYHYWRKGFGGSVLLFGTRLSGKTSILQSLSDTITEEEIISIMPNQTITYLGRKYDPNYSLKGALDFLNKHSITHKVIVVIDDLELWRSPEVSFYQNMIALQESIGKNGKRLFFIVSTNNWMKIHLDNHLNFSDQFIVRISSNHMGIQDIISAIKIRHAATYQGTLNTEIKEYERTLIQQAKKVAIASNGNVGSSLKDWGRNAIISGENFNEFNFDKMPDIVARHLIKHRLILTHLFRFRQSSETELRTMIGDSFVRDINQRIQLLIGLGVLKRKLNGVFSINEMLINETETLIFGQHGKLSYTDE